jgi:hypothetical protein
LVGKRNFARKVLPFNLLGEFAQNHPPWSSVDVRHLALLAGLTTIPMTAVRSIPH